jgi:hypothetical protein
MSAFQSGCVKSELVRERKREYKCITYSGFSGDKPIFYKIFSNFLAHLQVIWRLCPTKVTQQSGDIQRCTILSSLCNSERNYEMFNSGNCWGLQTFEGEVDCCSADQLCFGSRPWRFICISSLFLLSFVGRIEANGSILGRKVHPNTRNKTWKGTTDAHDVVEYHFFNQMFGQVHPNIVMQLLLVLLF